MLNVQERIQAGEPNVPTETSRKQKVRQTFEQSGTAAALTRGAELGLAPATLRRMDFRVAAGGAANKGGPHQAGTGTGRAPSGTIDPGGMSKKILNDFNCLHIPLLLPPKIDIFFNDFNRISDDWTDYEFRPCSC
jgi:hypothetical protein